MLDVKVLLFGMLGGTVAMQVPAEWISLVIGAVITALVAYIASRVTEAQKTRESVAEEVIRLKVQMVMVNENLKRLQDHIDHLGECLRDERHTER